MTQDPDAGCAQRTNDTRAAAARAKPRTYKIRYRIFFSVFFILTFENFEEKHNTKIWIVMSQLL